MALIYQAVIFRPLVTVVNYQVNKDFIAKNLCEQKEVKTSTCAGKCYLKKELKKVTQQSDSNSEEPSGKRLQGSEEEVVHVSSDQNLKFASFYLLKEPSSKFTFLFSDCSVSVDVPPPLV